MTIRQIIKKLYDLTSTCVDYGNTNETYYITTSTTTFNTFVSYNCQLWHKEKGYIINLNSFFISIEDTDITINNKIETYKQEMFDKIFDYVKSNS